MGRFVLIFKALSLVTYQTVQIQHSHTAQPQLLRFNHFAAFSTVFTFCIFRPLSNNIGTIDCLSYYLPLFGRNYWKVAVVDNVN